MSKIVKWEDDFGRKQASLLPDHAPDSDAPKGVSMLSIDVDELNIPEPLLTNVHNQLVLRELWDWPTVQKKGGRQALMTALLGAIKPIVVELTQLYRREVK